MSDSKKEFAGNLPKLISIDNLLKNTWLLYKQGLAKFVGLTILPILGIIPLVFVMGLFIANTIVFRGNEIAFRSSQIATGLLGIVAFLFVIYFSISVQAGLYILISRYSKEAGIWESFQKGRKLVLAYFVVSILVFICIIGWTLLLIVPGIIFGVYYAFSYWVLIDEGSGGMKALKRSQELVRGYWWAVVFRYLALFALYFVFLGVCGWILGGLSQQNETMNVISGLLLQALNIIISPFFIIYQFFIYKSLKEAKK